MCCFRRSATSTRLAAPPRALAGGGNRVGNGRGNAAVAATDGPPRGGNRGRRSRAGRGDRAGAGHRLRLDPTRLRGHGHDKGVAFEWREARVVAVAAGGREGGVGPVVAVKVGEWRGAKHGAQLVHLL